MSDFYQTRDDLSLAKEGDRDALERLFERYSDRVLGIVRIRMGARLRRHLDSRDIVQESLEEAFLAFDRFEIREDARFLQWLATIVEHRIANKAHYYEAQKRDEGRNVPLTAGKLEPARTRSQASPSSEIAQQEEQQLVVECIASLPERYRELITLRDYVGASWQDVAEATGHPSSEAARMTHARARRALGTLLRERGLR